MPTNTATATDQQLLDDLVQLVDKPLAWVYWAYPWGQGELEDSDGPDDWQRDVLLALEEDLRTTTGAVRLAVASGNGVGKGALTAWLVQWFAATRPYGQGVVTANTLVQLSTKTWREVAKWHKLSRLRHWFEWSAAKYTARVSPEDWYVTAIPWSERNPEAFAGTHARHVLGIFDESSAIVDPIWDTFEGAMTGPEPIWVAFGNPTRNAGRFRELFSGGRFAAWWRTWHVDGRDAKRTNKVELQQMIAAYGEESDYVRIHVKGQFPQASELQFIGADLVQAARQRDLQPWSGAPKVLGVDVAHTGMNRTVLCSRHGPVIVWQRVYRGKRVDEVAGLVREAMDQVQPDATFVDAIGVGAGVYDLLRHTHHSVIAVQSGIRLPALDSAGQHQPWHNKRAQMWGRMREWLEQAGCLPDDPELCAELQAPEYSYVGIDQLLLESKEDMQRRGLASPDKADALALTFAEPVRSVEAAGGMPLFARGMPFAERDRRAQQQAPVRATGAGRRW